MTNSVNNVVVGKPLVTGGISVAPLGTVLPTDATTALDPAYTPVGYVTDNGVTKSEKRNTGTIAAWGGDTIAATKKGMDVTIKLAMAELLNKIVQGLIYGDANVVATPATATKGNLLKVTGTSAPTPRKVWVIEVFSDQAKVRVVFPIAKVMDVGDTTFKDDAIAAADATLQAFPDATGAYFYQYSDDGQKTA
ncbi:phage tail protein [Pseudarthrobacter sp. NIBRBAC000502770]|uniref:phage tail tube protein n=1 Tax=Pseudarthrobacter sp. NIBRBAC000502770 TaxID=2590785 RepID=UPI00113FDAFA|nr:phage tail protein [Pseudarthrobacter sp. NIBRBAC000502770]QDG88867.1 phage tail protein [Pseudarthrobacter sp. NIBRBAC000502770]